MEWQQIIEKCRGIKVDFEKAYKCLNTDRQTSQETIEKHLGTLLTCLEDIRTILNVNYNRLTASHKTAAAAFFQDIRNKIIVIATRKEIRITLPNSIQEAVNIKTFRENMASFSLETVSKALQTFTGNYFELESFLITAELLNKTFGVVIESNFIGIGFKTDKKIALVS